MATIHRLHRAVRIDRRAPPAPPALGYTVRPLDEGGTVVAVSGEVDLATADDLRRTLSAIASVEQRTLRIDLGSVAFMDCAGLRALLELDEAMDLTGGRLELVRARPMVRELLQITGLDRLLG